MRPLLALLLAAAPAFAEDLIAKPDARTPADELAGFKLPPGFQAQLVASEPDIGKPIQIAFDSAGRLWATTSRHYPFPAEKGKATDKLYVLSDFDATGKAKKVEVFCDSLNIPIGVLPLPDGKSCLVSEVGRILKLTDTKGTGKADQIEEILTGFGTEDTHGMTNSFLHMPDGWVYATHGFKNNSLVRAKDGSVVSMNSGNTFRFKPDGGRIEIVTRGQVNPFGLCCDPYLNLYTADCHSKPITQLIRHATYQSFAKPHDGLGFAPHVTDHSHGSTALCGLQWYSDTKFPKQYQNCMFLGNVVTNRINADRITFKGSTPVTEELPDFLTSSDPWFRPTDIKLGMDGALYVADFYNRIIGHYEVKLDHPQRDKDRGRIWRIVWTGQGEPGASATGVSNLTKAKPAELLLMLYGSNLTTKLLAFHELVLKCKTEPNILNDGTRVALPEGVGSDSGDGWTCFLRERTSTLDLKGYSGTLGLQKLIPPEDQRRLSGAVIRALASKPEWNDAERGFVATFFEAFPDTPWMNRALVDGIVLHPHADFVQPLLKFLPKIPAEDTHLKFATRVALRDCLQLPNAWDGFDSKSLLNQPALVEMAVAVPSANAAKLLAEGFWKKDFPADQRRNVAEMIAKHGITWDWEQVVEAPWVVMPKDGRALEFLAVAQSFMKALLASGRNKELFDKASDVQAAMTRSLFSALPGSDYPEDIVRETLRTARLYLQLGPARQLGAVYRIEESLLKYVAKPTLGEATTAEAFEAICTNPTPETVAKFTQMVQDVAIPVAVRVKMAVYMVRSSPTLPQAVAAKDMIKPAPYALAVQLAVALAADPFGADLLLAAVKAGDAPARLLQEKAVLDRLKATKVADLDAKVKALTAGLPSPEKRIDDLIKARAAGFPKAKADAGLGKAVFAKHCAACHQVENVGARVGPQLDGIGGRGLDRLLEDTLDPSRNVDAAFRATTFDMLDGRTVVGLLAREEGGAYVVFNNEGKELRLPKADVVKQKTSALSAMPANVDAIVPEADYYHLMAYLLSQKPK